MYSTWKCFWHKQLFKNNMLLLLSCYVSLGHLTAQVEPCQVRPTLPINQVWRSFVSDIFFLQSTKFFEGDNVTIFWSWRLKRRPFKHTPWTCNTLQTFFSVCIVNYSINHTCHPFPCLCMCNFDRNSNMHGPWRHCWGKTNSKVSNLRTFFNLAHYHILFFLMKIHVYYKMCFFQIETHR